MSRFLVPEAVVSRGSLSLGHLQWNDRGVLSHLLGGGRGGGEKLGGFGPTGLGIAFGSPLCGSAARHGGGMQTGSAHCFGGGGDTLVDALA